MLPLSSKIAFVLFALLTLTLAAHGFYRLYLRIRRGRPDPEPRFDHLLSRVRYALITSLTQQRTFRKRPVIGIFHSFIFYGFVFYSLVNLIDAIEGFFPFTITSATTPGAIYNALADALSFLVLIGVIALVIRRFALPSRRDFRFNQRTLLHKDVQLGKIPRDSLIVSAFILFHVGSRAIGAGAKIAAEGADRFQPFATALSHLFTSSNTDAWRIFGYWGALGSVLAFLAYFPYTKHIHIFMAPAKYLAKREAGSGVLPPVAMDAMEQGHAVGASRLEDFAWPRLLDAWACIQCNRCQDVCPATATGKSLSPAALEINKRMELNVLAAERSPFALAKAPFESGSESPHPLLQFALSPEAAWACTTCGACMQVCPVEDEQMLDIIDIRRNQVMIEGEFPAQLQTAFRGMERSQNPWGINREQRLAWADGLNVRTTDENPTPDVLYWVGCAASYDPQAQKTARAFVELLNHAEVNFAVLGKKECCTGDSARRAGNEYLYHQLADQNVTTLNQIKPQLIVASCPHCMNALGHEYKQIGGNYQVIHHTEYLERLVHQNRLPTSPSPATITYHDPCYLGRHNGVYEAPRNLLQILGTSIELERTKENSFCCGAGGAQFWKEEEPGEERISQNRMREVQSTLASASNEKILAVGCPFCKSMLSSSPGNDDLIQIKDVAELLWEGVQRKNGIPTTSEPATPLQPAESIPSPLTAAAPSETEASEPRSIAAPEESPAPEGPAVERKKWQPKTTTAPKQLEAQPAPSTTKEEPPASVPPTQDQPPPPDRKKWQPKPAAAPAPAEATSIPPTSKEAPLGEPPQQITPPEERKKWQPKAAATPVPATPPEITSPTPDPVDQPTPEAAPARKKWTPKKPAQS